MQRQRQERERKALDLLKAKANASALELGAAALKGEPCAQSIGRRGKQEIGFAIANKLVERGLALPTRGNCFMLAPCQSDGVTP